MSTIRIDDVTAVVEDPPARAGAPSAAAPSAASTSDPDRRAHDLTRLDELLRHRAVREARVFAD